MLRFHKTRGFTLGELIASIAILAVLGCIVLPIFYSRPDGRNKARCWSNVKTLSLGLLNYSEDYDGHFPGVLVYGKDGDRLPWDRILREYFRGADVYHCPSLSNPKNSTTFLYNDLLAGRSIEAVAAPGQTFMVVDGEDVEVNAGHSWTPDTAPLSAQPDSRNPERVAPGKGATVQSAPRRHQEGAIYAYADGHARWIKPEQVFFPPRSSDSITAEPGEPVPQPERSPGKKQGPQPSPGPTPPSATPTPYPTPTPIPEQMKGYLGTFRLR